MRFDYLLTNRLKLRKITPEVMNHVFTTMQDSDIIDFLALSDFQSLEKEKNKYCSGLSSFNRSFVNFQLIDKKTDKIIGGCGFHTWQINHNRAELGYGLLYENYKRKGLMTEALKAILSYGFNEMNLNRVEALTSEDNIASIAVLKHFDFKFEGILREHYNANGNMEDSFMYSLLKHEFNLNI